jgi:hypothetical protein
MAKIIDFWEAKRALEMRELNRVLQDEHKEKEEIKPPRKIAKIISALPGETIPPEFIDLRPHMQRDGLILLTWATWIEDGLQNYKIHWVKSCGRLRKYSDTWFIQDDINKMFKEAMPDRIADIYYRKGLIGNYWRIDRTVDYVFICSPELTALTRLLFIDKLKQSGVNVDFNFDFSLGKAKELEFKKQVEAIQSLNAQKEAVL